jgi:formylglycine-generating enzyme required for sulfatase activity
VEFLRRLSALGVGKFRLPTEAEWEYACRAGTTSRFYWGDIDEAWEAYPHAWTNSRSFATTHRVGTKPPNAWGLFDMSGNVWAWCADSFAAYDSADQQSDDTLARRATDGKMKVIRGGSWFNEPEALRSANRHRHPLDSRQTNLGFRVLWRPTPE